MISGPDVLSGIGLCSAAVRAGDFLFRIRPARNRLRDRAAGGTNLRGAGRAGISEPRGGAAGGGSRLDLVVNTTVLVADGGDFAELNLHFEKAFPSGPPARMTMPVPLPLGLLISIGCTALVEG